MPLRMRRFSRLLALLLIGGFFLSVAPSVSAAQVRHRIVIVRPIAPFYYDPFFPYGFYPYPYPAYTLATNYGEVKIDTHHKFAKVSIDGGYTATITKAKKFDLRPGTQTIALKNSDDVTFYHQRITVVVGQTTKLTVS